MRLPALAAFAVLLSSASAFGEGCPAPAGASPRLEAIAPEARLAFVQDSLRRSAHRASVWTWTWRGGYALLTAGQLALVPVVSTADERTDLYVGAASSGIALLLTFALPLDVRSDAPALDERVAHAGTPPSCAVLADAEKVLAHDADDEAFGQRWFVHGGNLVFNVGVGLVLGLGYKHWTSGIINAAAGTAIGEVQILTQPTDAVDALARYRSGDLGRAEARRALRLSLAPLPIAGARGAAIALRF